MLLFETKKGSPLATWVDLDSVVQVTFDPGTRTGSGSGTNPELTLSRACSGAEVTDAEEIVQIAAILGISVP
jgi:hypothetical protein